MKIKLLIYAIATMVVGCDGSQVALQRLASNRSDSFSTISTGVTNGASRAEVLSKMGVPSSMDVTAIAGINTESLVFDDSRFRYHIRLVNGRALTKSASPTNSELSSK